MSDKGIGEQGQRNTMLLERPMMHPCRVGKSLDKFRRRPKQSKQLVGIVVWIQRLYSLPQFPKLQVGRLAWMRSLAGLSDLGGKERVVHLISLHHDAIGGGDIAVEVRSLSRQLKLGTRQEVAARDVGSAAEHTAF